jgi:hypothetical protein
MTISDTEPLPWDMPQIASVEGVTSADFFNDILPRSQPVVIRGLVADWPAVQLARQSDRHVIDHIKPLDNGVPVEVMEAPAATRGRLFYTDDLRQFNFVKRTRTLSETLERIIAQAGALEPEVVYCGSIPIQRHLPAFALANPAPLPLPVLAPRIWIGGRARVQTHFDPLHNLACSVAGRRRFVVFPPDQVANLYLGPFELTPAGAAISLASLEEPDLERFPKLRLAMRSAATAILEPGDALFIPHYWLHHVTALEGFNAQVNYWWGPEERYGLDNPRNSFLTALLGLKDLEGDEKVFWKAMVDHYVFQSDDDPVAHIPADLQGAFGKMSPLTRARIRSFVLSLLNEGELA